MKPAHNNHQSSPSGPLHNPRHSGESRRFSGWNIHPERRATGYATETGDCIGLQGMPGCQNIET